MVTKVWDDWNNWDEVFVDYTSENKAVNRLCSRNPKRSKDEVHDLIAKLVQFRALHKIPIHYYVLSGKTSILKTGIHYEPTHCMIDYFRSVPEIVFEKEVIINNLRSEVGCKVVNILFDEERMSAKQLGMRINRGHGSCVHNILKNLKVKGIVECKTQNNRNQCISYSLTKFAKIATRSIREQAKQHK